MFILWSIMTEGSINNLPVKIKTEPSWKHFFTQRNSTSIRMLTIVNFDLHESGRHFYLLPAFSLASARSLREMLPVLKLSIHNISFSYATQRFLPVSIFNILSHRKQAVRGQEIPCSHHIISEFSAMVTCTDDAQHHICFSISLHLMSCPE